MAKSGFELTSFRRISASKPGRSNHSTTAPLHHIYSETNESMHILNVYILFTVTAGLKFHMIYFYSRYINFVNFLSLKRWTSRTKHTCRYCTFSTCSKLDSTIKSVFETLQMYFQAKKQNLPFEFLTHMRTQKEIIGQTH